MKLKIERCVDFSGKPAWRLMETDEAVAHAPYELAFNYDREELEKAIAWITGKDGEPSCKHQSRPWMGDCPRCDEGGAKR